MAREWHIITCEYPDDPGGVSDHSYFLAAALLNHDSIVHVWCPGSPNAAQESQIEDGIVVHRVLGKFRVSDMVRTGGMLNDCASGKRVLVQWVPHGYGNHSMNILFCFWLLKRKVFNSDEIDLIVHEPFLPFQKGRWKQNFAAFVHRMMAMILLQAAKRVWVSASAWKRLLSPLRIFRKPSIEVLPAASNVPVVDDPEGILQVKRKYAPEGFLIGHFGTYEHLVRKELEKILPKLESLPERISIVLFGKGSDAFFSGLVRQNPQLQNHVFPLDYLSRENLSKIISSCDLLVQPYSEGANMRRTTLMAGLSHGIPIVSTRGPLTDDLWIDHPAIILAPHSDPDAVVSAIQQLLQNSEKRDQMRSAAIKLYQERFDWRHIVSTLQNSRQV